MLKHLVCYLWAAPATAIGLSLGAAGLPWGTKVRRRGRTIEFYGGLVAELLRRGLPRRNVIAITLGHVILGRDEVALDFARAHELVHVRQYERWGPAFIPAYVGWSMLVWLRGGDAYWDNPFEREAYAAEQLRGPLATGEDGRA